MAAFITILAVLTVSDIIDIVKTKNPRDYAVYFALIAAVAVGGCVYYNYVNV